MVSCLQQVPAWGFAERLQLLKFSTTVGGAGQPAAAPRPTCGYGKDAHMARKCIGKKMRFEIMKRDGFACIYCGRKPPEVSLEIDHVVAIATNGAHHPSNMVTACYDCNRGKGKRSLTDIPAPLAGQMEQAAETRKKLEEHQKVLHDIEALKEEDAWKILHLLQLDQLEKTGAVSNDWFRGVSVLLKRVDREVLFDLAAWTACNHPFRKRDKSRFLTFCKAAWNIVREGEQPCESDHPTSGQPSKT